MRRALDGDKEVPSLSEVRLAAVIAEANAGEAREERGPA